MRVVIGSANAGKIAEYRRMLRGLDLDLLAAADLDPVPPEPAEEGETYAENAEAKARAYARAAGLPAIADDSGLEVEALGGAPGVRSRRYFGEDVGPEESNRRLLALLDGVTDRRARFVCVAALAYPDGPVELFEGEVRGEIALEPRDAGQGFGYDPVFVITADGRTMAELSPEQKDAISHRGVAVAKLRSRLSSEPR